VIFCTIYLFLWLKTKYYLYVLLIYFSYFDCSFVWHWPWCIVLIIHVQHKIICERSNRNKKKKFIIVACQNMKIKFWTSSNLFIVPTIILQIMSLQIRNVRCILCTYSLVIILCLKAFKSKSYAKVLSTQNIENPIMSLQFKCNLFVTYGDNYRKENDDSSQV
jgi:hypothetical protein